MNLKNGLIVVSILLAISVALNVYFYSKQYGITADGGLQDQVTDLQDQINALENERQILRNNLSTKNDEIAQLETELAQSKKAKLVAPSELWAVGERDTDVFLTDGFFHEIDYVPVTGIVWNAGADSAYQPKIHINFYKEGNVFAASITVPTGDISGKPEDFSYETWRKFNVKVIGIDIGGFGYIPLLSGTLADLEEAVFLTIELEWSDEMPTLP